MHAVLVEIVAAHRQEGAGSDVECDEGMWQLGEDLGREMQSGRGCGHRSGDGRVNRLVTNPVVRIVLASEIRRDGHVSEFFEIGRVLKSYDTRAVVLIHGFDVRHGPGDGKAVAGASAFARTREGFPSGRSELLEEQ